MTAKVKNVIPQEQKSLGSHAQGLRFHVLDEPHAYRDSQGADVAMRVNRVRNAFIAYHLQYNGTSAMLSSSGSFEEER